ncbi:type II secretion system F family protein [bacterium]|jgi:type II secretory pathway component PulF|nr:type II secretion system F family protein [bacterium]
MRTFKIKFITASGQLKEEPILGKSLKDARLKILEKHTASVIIKVEKVSSLMPSLNKFLQPKIEKKDVMQFTAHLQSLSQAGISIVECLKIIENIVHKKSLKQLINQLTSKLIQGQSFSKSLNELPELYTEEFIALISAGEKVGKLDEILKTLYQLLQWDEELSKKVQKAFRYPLIVMGVGFTAMIGVFTFIIPKFAVFFTSNKVDLPILTKTLLSISNFLVDNKLILFIALLGIIQGLFLASKNKKMKSKIDLILVKTPLFGEMYKNLIVSKSMKIFAILYENGIPILDSLKIIQTLSKNEVFQQDIAESYSNIKQGLSLGKASNLTFFFSGLAAQMITVGENSGNLGSMLEKTSQLYRDLVENVLERIFTYIEPILIGIIGMLVLVLALGIFTPMLNMMSVMSQG